MLFKTVLLEILVLSMVYSKHICFYANFYPYIPVSNKPGILTKIQIPPQLTG